MLSVDTYTPALPPAHWEAIRGFVRESVLSLPDLDQQGIRRYLPPVTKHVHWCWQTAGLPLQREIIFHRDTIEEFARVGLPDLAPTTRGNYRTVLLRVAEHFMPLEERVSRLTPLCNPMPSTPYTEHDVQRLRSWAAGQATARRRVEAQTLLALGLGAGLTAAEIVAVRVADLIADDEGIQVHVRHQRERLVPVLAQWEPALLHLIEHAPPQRCAFGVFRESEQAGRNYVNRFVEKSNGMGLKPNSHRMRATWMVNHMAWGTPIKLLRDAAGLTTLETLDRYMRFVPDVHSNQQARALLRERIAGEPELGASGEA